MQAPDARLDSIGWMFGRLRDHTARMFEPIARASEGADIVVGAGAQLVTSSIAEWRDVPHAMFAFCPCAMPTSAAPPPTVRTQTLPPWVNRLLWQVGAPVADLLLRGTINRGRASLGLGPSAAPLTHISDSRVIIAADPDLAPPGDDAPASVVSTDALVFDEGRELEPASRRLPEPGPLADLRGLRQHGRGRRRRSDRPGDRRRTRRRPSARSSQRAGPGSIATWPQADDILTVGSVPHRAVFPRVAVIVHHGGAGTTTAAASGGVPQVILPHLLDQFYWAHRHRAARSGSTRRCPSPSSPPTSWPTASTSRSTTRHPQTRRGARTRRRRAKRRGCGRRSARAARRSVRSSADP